jgi:hypothetical protein
LRTGAASCEALHRYFLAVVLILPGTTFAFGRLLFDFLERRAA